MQNTRLSIGLPWRRYLIELDLGKSGSISSFPAATLRGGFGITLRGLVCAATFSTLCRECILRGNCVYARVFEPSPLSGAPRLSKIENIPRPFILAPVQKGDKLNVNLTLFGNAGEMLPYFIYTLNALGKKGLGRNRIRYSVTQVSNTGGDVVYSYGSDVIKSEGPPNMLHVSPGAPEQGKAKLHFTTPFIIRENGKVLGSITPRTFVATLLRRATNLNAFYGKNPETTTDPAPYLKAAETLAMTWDLHRRTQARFSTRQAREIDYTGFIGSVTMQGDVGTLLPLLKAGEITGVGKNTVFGYGKYEMEKIASGCKDEGTA